MGSQGRSGRVRKISPLSGLDPRTVQPVASRYTDWAISAYGVKLNTSTVWLSVQISLYINY